MLGMAALAGVLRLTGMVRQRRLKPGEEVTELHHRLGSLGFPVASSLKSQMASDAEVRAVGLTAGSTTSRPGVLRYSAPPPLGEPEHCPR